MKLLTNLKSLVWKEWLHRLGGVLTDEYGAFRLISESRPGNMLACIASTTDGWDHVSVSCELSLPTWTEMEQVKRTFFHEHETAMQLHVPPPRSCKYPSELPAPLATARRGHPAA